MKKSTIQFNYVKEIVKESIGVLVKSLILDELWIMVIL